MNHRLFLQNLKSIKKPVTELDWQNRNLNEGIVSTTGKALSATGREGSFAGLNIAMLPGAADSWLRLTGNPDSQGRLASYNPKNRTDAPGTKAFSDYEDESKVAAAQYYRDSEMDRAQDIANVATGAGALLDLTGMGVQGVGAISKSAPISAAANAFQKLGHPLLLGGIAATSGLRGYRHFLSGEPGKAVEPLTTTAASVASLVNSYKNMGLNPFSYATFAKDLSGMGGEATREFLKTGSGWKGAEALAGLGAGATMKLVTQKALQQAANKKAAGALAMIPATATAIRDVKDAYDSFKQGEYADALGSLGLGAAEFGSGVVGTAAGLLKMNPLTRGLAAVASTGIDAGVAAARAERDDQRFFEEQQKGWRDKEGYMTKQHPKWNEEIRKAQQDEKDALQRQQNYPQPA